MGGAAYSSNRAPEVTEEKLADGQRWSDGCSERAEGSAQSVCGGYSA